jgi:hypothetical protein
MFERIHQKLGTAGFVISIVALIAALGGGAYAATSNSGQATASAKAKQGKQGKPGKTGKTGPAGPAGPAGPQGPAGPTGPKGDTGGAGTNGSNGKSVVVTAIAEGGSKCEGRAGSEVKQEGTASGQAVCNGKNGTTGFTETLPPGKSETGNWSAIAGALGGVAAAASVPFPISYNIPLAQPSEHVVYLDAEETELSEGSGECELEAGLGATPVAPPGYLCVFTRGEPAGSVGFIGNNRIELGDTPAGALVWGYPNAQERVAVYGTWAVTAAE